MITGDLKNQIDKLWMEFWQGGIANPLTVIEQITFLMFARLLDINEIRDEKRSKHTGKKFKNRFGAHQQHLRWSKLIHIGNPDDLMTVVRDEVFKHIREHDVEGGFSGYMKDARLAIDKPSLLQKAVRMIDNLPLEAGDTKGDLYEYLLSKLSTAGVNGQFRTPRHIINLMVHLLQPKPNETVADPACGTAGFLVSVMEYLQQTYSSPEGIIKEKVTSEDGTATAEKVIYTGDLLTQEQWAHIKNNMFHGFDFDATMLRISAMNLYMHGVDDPDIHYQDTLAQSFGERFPNAEQNAFNVILANPPFTGTLDADTVNPAISRMVKTGKTELLFLAQILRMLKLGGRSATVVPQGVLFGSSTAHRELRRILVEDQQLEAVISLPSGVFKPYAGVATAILLFTKTNGGGTDHVWFYDMLADGYSLDDKRQALVDADKLGVTPATSLTADEHEKNNLPDILKRWSLRAKSEVNNPRTAQSFCVPASEIAAAGYDLSLNRYKEVVHEQVDHVPPKQLIAELKQLEAEIQAGLVELEGLLK